VLDFPYVTHGKSCSERKKALVMNSTGFALWRCFVLDTLQKINSTIKKEKTKHKY
jgi:hypothetical protein